MRQVVGNLLDNAIKIQPDWWASDDQHSLCGNQAVISFRDTGIGIPAGELPEIWDRLYRGDKSRSQPGLGLGLSLLKAIVGAHGGEVEVHSKPGAGA